MAVIKLKNVQIFTDGACSGNPGPGGWAAILRYGTKERELCGGEPHTTNNRMELTAVIKGLEALKETCAAEVVSDSTYVVHAIEKGWMKNWMRNGWRKAGNKPLPNDDLWKKLAPLLERHQVQFKWIRGHAGHPENERCDELAVAYYRNLK